MSFTAADRAAVTELLSLHGYLMDGGEWDRLGELFTPDVTYDLSDFGAGSLEGIPAIKDAALALGDRNPVAHHVTNVVLSDHTDDRVRARSKGIGVYADGTAGSVSYEDVVVRGDHGWRISARKVLARRTPLSGR